LNVRLSQVYASKLTENENMKYLAGIFIIMFVHAGIGQTQKIAHRSHSGKNKAFKTVGWTNLGMAFNESELRSRSINRITTDKDRLIAKKKKIIAYKTQHTTLKEKDRNIEYLNIVDSLLINIEAQEQYLKFSMNLVNAQQKLQDSSDKEIEVRVLKVRELMKKNTDNKYAKEIDAMTKELTAVKNDYKIKMDSLLRQNEGNFMNGEHKLTFAIEFYSQKESSMRQYLRQIEQFEASKIKTKLKENSNTKSLKTDEERIDMEETQEKTTKSKKRRKTKKNDAIFQASSNVEYSNEQKAKSSNTEIDVQYPSGVSNKILTNSPKTSRFSIWPLIILLISSLGVTFYSMYLKSKNL